MYKYTLKPEKSRQFVATKSESDSDRLNLFGTEHQEELSPHPENSDLDAKYEIARQISNDDWQNIPAFSPEVAQDSASTPLSTWHLQDNLGFSQPAPQSENLKYRDSPSKPAYNPEDSSNEVIYPATSLFRVDRNRGGDSQIGNETFTSDLESSLVSQKGNGSPLNDQTEPFIESRFDLEVQRSLDLLSAPETIQKAEEGPYHPPEGFKLKCNPEDDCSTLSLKINYLKHTIASHEKWDIENPNSKYPSGRHAEEIADLKNALRKCINYTGKCRNQPQSLPAPEQQQTPQQNMSMIVKALAILGLSAALVLVVAAAITDPEPITKLTAAGLSRATAIALLGLLGITLKNSDQK